MIVVVILSRRDDIKNLFLALVDSHLCIQALRCYNHMQLFIILRLGRPSSATIFNASLTSNRHLTLIIPLQTFLRISPGTKNQANKIKRSLFFLRKVELISHPRRAHTPRGSEIRVQHFQTGTQLEALGLEFVQGTIVTRVDALPAVVIARLWGRGTTEILHRDGVGVDCLRYAVESADEILRFVLFQVNLFPSCATASLALRLRGHVVRRGHSCEGFQRSPLRAAWHCVGIR